MINRIKYLLWFWLLFLFWFINYSGAYIIPIWSYWTNMINSTTQNFDIQVTTNWTFLTNNLWVTKKLLYIYNPWNILQYAFWSDNWLIYWIYNSSNQGYFKQYFTCPVAVWTDFNFTTAGCSLNVIDLTDYSWQVEVYKSFFWSLTTNDNLFYSNSMLYNWSFFPWFCVWNSSLWKSMCFLFNSYSIDGVIWTRVLPNLDINVSSYWNIENSLLSDPPTVSWWWESSSDDEIVWIELNSVESAINYYETNYWRDENICYVWVDNLTDLWGSSVSFQSWTWLNIFQAYSWTYWNLELNKVYVWLNTWLINYEQWFYRETPLYLANYNSWTNAVDLYYNDLTFPFSWKPIAYYFMSDNIESYSPYSTMWSSVVSYCNLKLNNWTFDQIIDQADKNNINNYTEQSNKNNWLNPDWTKITIDFSWFGAYTGDAWVSSWIEIDFSGDTTLKSSLRNFFERIDVLFGDTIETENNTRTRWGLRSVWSILPSYIVYGLLFVVLFKLLRRR